MATGDPARTASLARFFESVVRQALGDLRLGGPAEGAYLAQLLTRFARAEELYAIRDAAGRPLDSVAGLLIEAERAWDFRAPDFDPFRERRVRQHVGDYALFMTGLFREHVERRVGARTTSARGSAPTRPWRTSSARPSGRRPRLFAALAAGFERYAAALGYLKRGLFPPRRVAPGPPARAAAPDPMVATALDALVGGEPTDEAVEAALATIPARRARAGAPLARPPARGRRPADPAASAWRAVRSAPSPPPRRWAPCPCPRRRKRSRPRRRARPRRRCAPRLDGRSTGFARPASTAARRAPPPPRRGSGSAKRGCPRSTARVPGVSGSRCRARTASARCSRRCCRTRPG